MIPRVMIGEVDEYGLLSKEERMEMFMEGREGNGLGVMLETSPEFLRAMLNAIGALAELGEQAEREAVWHTGKRTVKPNVFEIGPMYHSIMMAPYVLLCLHTDDDGEQGEGEPRPSETRLNTALNMANEMWVPLLQRTLDNLRKENADT